MYQTDYCDSSFLKVQGSSCIFRHQKPPCVGSLQKSAKQSCSYKRISMHIQVIQYIGSGDDEVETTGDY